MFDIVGFKFTEKLIEATILGNAFCRNFVMFPEKQSIFEVASGQLFIQQLIDPEMNKDFGGDYIILVGQNEILSRFTWFTDINSS